MTMEARERRGMEDGLTRFDEVGIKTRDCLRSRFWDGFAGCVESACCGIWYHSASDNVVPKICTKKDDTAYHVLPPFRYLCSPPYQFTILIL